MIARHPIIEGPYASRRNHHPVGNSDRPRLNQHENALGDASVVLIRGNMDPDLSTQVTKRMTDTARHRLAGFDESCSTSQQGTTTASGFVCRAISVANELGFEKRSAATFRLPTPVQFHTCLPICRQGHGRHREDCPVFNPHAKTTVLVDAGHPQGRLSRLRTILASIRQDQVSLGFVARADWTHAELNVLRGIRCWVFFGRREALCVAGVGETEEAARRLKLHLGRGPRLLVSLPPEGGYLLHGPAAIVGLPATAIDRGDDRSTCDTTAAFATLASSCGIPDEKAARLAVDAAIRRAAGLQSRCDSTHRPQYKNSLPN